MRMQDCLEKQLLHVEKETKKWNLLGTLHINEILEL